MSRNDPELVRDCINGDETAWKALVNKYSRLVYSIPFRFDLSASDAEDVLQAVFTIAFRELKNLRSETSLPAWLITITRRESLRVIRTRREHAELGEEIEDGDTPAPEQVEQWERQHLVQHALAQIELRCRDLLYALFIETPTPRYERIASRLGIPLGSIGPTRARCFKKLQAVLIAIGFDEQF